MVKNKPSQKEMNHLPTFDFSGEKVVSFWGECVLFFVDIDFCSWLLKIDLWMITVNSYKYFYLRNTTNSEFTHENGWERKTIRLSFRFRSIFHGQTVYFREGQVRFIWDPWDPWDEWLHPFGISENIVLAEIWRASVEMFFRCASLFFSRSF